LRQLGFDVAEVFDGEAAALNEAADRFVKTAERADLALFYFAGHGIQLHGRNFLLARDVDPGHAATPEQLGLDLAKFLASLARSGAVRRALVIDACRNKPFSSEDTAALLDRLRATGGPAAGGPAAGGPATGEPAPSRGLADMA